MTSAKHPAAGAQDEFVPSALPPSTTKAAVARALGVSDDTVGRMIQRGELKAYRVGPRLVRIPVSEVKRLLQPIVPVGR